MRLAAENVAAVIGAVDGSQADSESRDFLRCLFDEAFRAAGARPSQRVEWFEYRQRCLRGELHA